LGRRGTAVRRLARVAGGCRAGEGEAVFGMKAWYGMMAVYGLNALYGMMTSCGTVSELRAEESVGWVR
jgi:hypothetical protein